VGFPHQVKVERSRQKQMKKPADGVGFGLVRDLERAGCLLPWEEGEEKKVVEL
jgi:hypothetical protein